MRNEIGGLIAATALCVTASACSTSATDPSPAPTTLPGSAAPTTVPVGTTPTTAPGGAVPTAAPTSAAQATAAPGSTTLAIDASGTQASFHAHEQLAGNALPNEAVGSTSNVAGAIVLTNGAIDASQSQVTVDLASLTSDQSRRDNFIKSNTLQTSQYPNATFVAHDAVGLPSPLPSSGQAAFQLLGDLTVHGVTRPVTWQVTAQFN